ncbi:MAG TPA: HlyD family efflux transporter periplasmic adaptor subunit, partial [Burkholderiaceae bacterium]
APVAAPGWHASSPVAAAAASAAPVASAAPLATAPAAAVRPPGDATLALLDKAVGLAEHTLVFRRERQAAIEVLRRDSAATQAEADAARVAVMQAEADLLRARADAQARRQMLLDRARVDPPARPAPALAAAATTPASASPAAAAVGPTIVSSPFSGTVTAVMVSTGEYVTPSSEILLLQGQGAPAIEAYVAPSDAKYAKPGRRATLRFFDGGRVPAEVADVAAQTARIPAERVGPLSPRSQAILVRMRPLQELPPRYRINTLPLDVRFETVWPWTD